MTSDPAKATPPTEGAHTKAKAAGSFAILVAAGILLSRIAGLIRQRVFAHYFGNSVATGAFVAALRIPNALQNLFGEGVLSASFIPVYSKLLAEGREELAGRVAGVFATILALFITLLVILGVLFTPLLVTVIAPGFEGEARELTIRIVRILFPGMGLLVMSAWCLGILNSHRKFFISYVAPVLWNMAMIATMVAFGARMTQSSLAIALAWGTVAGSVLQFGVQLPFVYRYARNIRFGIDRGLEQVREIFRNMFPVVFGRGVVQISAFVDEAIASLLGPIALGSVGFASTIYLLPISLFGMSVAASELPQMSSALGTTEEIAAAVRKRLEAGLRQIAFFIVPTTVAFLLIGRFFVGALYQTGEFGSADTLFVWYILAGFSVGLYAVTLARLYSSAFYALRDTRTPLRFAIVRVVTGAALAFLFAFPLRRWVVWIITEVLGMPLPAVENPAVSIGAVGLALGAGFASWVEFVLLRGAMRKRVGPAPSPRSFQFTVWGAALLAGVAAWATGEFLIPRVLVMAEGSSLDMVLAAIGVAGVFGVIYIVGTVLAGLPEAGRLLGRFTRLVKR